MQRVAMELSSVLVRVLTHHLQMGGHYVKGLLKKHECVALKCVQHQVTFS